VQPVTRLKVASMSYKHAGVITITRQWCAHVR